jgi:D-alanyl-D-alanine carboxypeptidase/D-alanyl-D-alanine-endopeptidase (penicillin-binding protein 4)
MNTDSDNFTAEMLLKQLGAADGAIGTTAGGAAAVIAELDAAGIPTSGVRLLDGSGLSGGDRVTAAMLVAVLQAGLENPEIAGPFRASLALAGRTGTLARRYGIPAGTVRGKTGTTNLACTLSGLARGAIVFAVLQNGTPVASWAAREAQDRFATVLARESAATS